MKIALGADHGGFALKEVLKEQLQELGHEPVDVGCYSPDSVDYPDYAEKAVALIEDSQCEKGILICGTGIGMSIAANRHQAIRAANCFNEYTTQMSREHNDANVLCLGARVLAEDEAKKLVSIWLTTEFAGGRHQKRIAKFSR